MRREWEPEDLVACWTLVEADRDLIANKTGATRLGFALLLKYFELEGRFPRHAGEVPRQAVAYMGEQLRLDPGLFGAYGLVGRGEKRPRGYFLSPPSRRMSALVRPMPGLRPSPAAGQWTRPATQPAASEARLSPSRP